MIRGGEFLLKVLFIVGIVAACSSKIASETQIENKQNSSVATQQEVDSVYLKKTIVGAERTSLYIPLLKGKRVGVVSNQTSTIGSTHLVDSLLSLGINVQIVFSPEHGFRGDHDAGANIDHGKDEKTGLPIFSLHGKTKKPTLESIKNVDVILFDIQDVGVRFYTYISTLHYVLEAAGENNKEVVILDRPNPNAHYIDGPILQEKFKSFVGMHPVPIVYGMSIGEYGKMIVGEKWLKGGIQTKLKVISCGNWTYDKQYELPISPSPNLPNQLSIYMYPSLCFFEGTEVSVGRGTDFPFQTYGHPGYQSTETTFQYKPVSMPGKSKYPVHENTVCFGTDCRFFSKDSIYREAKINFTYLEDALIKTKPNEKFFNREDFFNLLAGNDTILNHLKKYREVGELPNAWSQEIEEFKVIRNKYLLY